MLLPKLWGWVGSEFLTPLPGTASIDRLLEILGAWPFPKQIYLPQTLTW
jgi:hypothetical protein